MLNYRRQHVINYPNWEDTTHTGVIYFLDDNYGAEPFQYFEENLHIFEINHPTGKYHLHIEREDWVSDDLQYLESILMAWNLQCNYPDETYTITDA